MAKVQAPSGQTVAGNARPYGLITLEGQDYIERVQIFASELTISFNNQVFTNQRLTLPGVADFLLKGMTRDVTTPPSGEIPPDVGSQDRRFRFRIMNTDVTPWFFTGGLGIFDDRAVDAQCFGNGQFPYFLIPPVVVHANGTLIYEVEDMGFGVPTDPDYFPYTIHFGFNGSYLIPADEAPQRQSFVYSVR